MALLGEMQKFTIEELEASLGVKSVKSFVQACESGFMTKLSEIAYDAAWNTKLKAIFISGPSSSGKTTFASRLASAIHFHGRPTCSISMDDYYIDELKPRYISGRPDLESIDTLDTALMAEHFGELTKGSAVKIPRFDFKTKRRIWDDGRVLKVPPRAILMTEGLHALSPELTKNLKREEYLLILIMPYATLFSDKRLIGPREIRVLRRLCRDSINRNTSALSTLDYWPMLDYMEEKIFPSYIERADIFVNSALKYEFCVIPDMAKGLLEEELGNAERGELKKPSMTSGQSDFADLPGAIAFAEKLLRVCKKLPRLDLESVPENSILNEFIK